jgi:hypothetical protein
MGTRSFKIGQSERKKKETGNSVLIHPTQSVPDEMTSPVDKAPSTVLKQRLAASMKKTRRIACTPVVYHIRHLELVSVGHINQELPKTSMAKTPMV